MIPTKTLGEFIIDNQNQFAYSTGELSSLLNAIRLAAKTVNHKVNKAFKAKFEKYKFHR